MRSSSDHKAEAERLIRLARTDEGKLEDDPRDPLVMLQLAQTHALLAAAPNAPTVDAHERQRDPAPVLADGAPIPDLTDLDLTNLLATRSLWTAAQWGNLMLIARDTREAIVLTKQQLLELRTRITDAPAGRYALALDDALGTALALDDALGTVNEWLKGFDA